TKTLKHDFGSTRAFQSSKHCLNMPVLIYCVARTAASLNELQTGVAGSPVIRMNVAPLNAYLSHSADSSEWLRAPLRTSALELQRATGAFATEWRQRLTKSELRSFALVERSVVPAFRESIAQAVLPPSVKVRVSGPWPVTEFLDKSDELA